MLLKSLYNYFGYIVEQYLPEVKHYAYYFGQEFDTNQINNYPAIYIELIPANISDLQDNAQLLTFNINIRLYANVNQSFTWADKNKKYSGDFLDLIDRVNAVFMLNRDVPYGYSPIKPESLRRINFTITPTFDKVKEAVIAFQFNVIDMSLIQIPIYAIANDANFTVEIVDN